MGLKKLINAAKSVSTALDVAGDLAEICADGLGPGDLPELYALMKKMDEKHGGVKEKLMLAIAKAQTADG